MAIGGRSPAWGAVTKLHAFPRTEDHLTQRTLSGAIVTILGILTMLVLFSSELSELLTPQVDYKMSIDDSPRHRMLKIHLNITLPALPCNVLSVDAMESSGHHDVDIDRHIIKTRLDRHGRALEQSVLHKDPKAKKKRKRLRHAKHGPGHAHGHGLAHDPSRAAYAAEEEEDEMEEEEESTGGAIARRGLSMEDAFREMFGTPERVAEIRQAIIDQEGCTLSGYVRVERVAGNFHVSVHGQSLMVLRQVFESPADVNMSHIIHDIHFGASYPGMVSPLANTQRMLPAVQPGQDKNLASGTFKYFIKVVPTEYRHISGAFIVTNQYSVTEYYSPGGSFSSGLPALFFLYDLSPIMVTITETRRSFLHFLTNLCAVLGGTFAVCGMLDRWVYMAIQAFMSSSQKPLLRNKHY